MGIIQNAINQTLQTAGIAARLSPDYERKQELSRLGKQEKAIQLQRESYSGDLQPGTSDYEILEGIESKGAELAQKRFELDPTSKNLERAAELRPLMTHRYTPSMSSLKLDAMRREQAMQDSADIQETQLKQQEEFKNYVTSLETSLGGKVGDLPDHVQALIMQQMKEDNKKDGE